MARNENENRNRNSLGYIIFPAFIGLLGVIIGAVLTTYLSNDLANKSWVKQVNYEEKKTISNKRIELIDKTASVFAKSPGISDIWSSYLKDLDKNEFEIKNIELSEKLAQYNSEYYSVISLDHLYFGPKTKAVIDELGKEDKPWWQKNKDLTDKLLTTLIEELNI